MQVAGHLEGSQDLSALFDEPLLETLDAWEEVRDIKSI